MMNKQTVSLLMAAGLLAITSCKSDKEQNLGSGIIVKNMDKSVKPGDNFDAYVNGAWAKANKIPADKSSYGVFDILNDKAQEDVKAIIEESAKGNFANGSNEQKVGDLYDSYLDMKTRNAKGINPIVPELSRIDGIKTYEDLAAYFGEANKNGNGSPIAVGVTEDFKDPTKYVLYAWQSGISLPEREYYFLQDEKSKQIREKFKAHVAKMFTLAGIADGDKKATEILGLETQIAAQHMKKELTRDMSLIYNKTAIADFKKYMPTFNMALMLDKAGIKNQKDILACQPGFLKAVDGIIKAAPLDTWKTYLKWNLIDNAAGSLTDAFDKQNFEFYGKVLSGTEAQLPLWRRGVEVVNGSLGEVIGEIYVKKHFSPEAKERMSEMVKNILAAYKESIQSLDWMTPATKKEALDKLSKFTPKIGYPDKWRDYSSLKIVKGDLYGNLERATAFEYNRQLDKLGKPVDRKEWGMTPQTINAYYNPSMNEIVFPAAILQPPFFDLTKDDAVNYGSIGAVIGHEIGHGFDDQGSTFDGTGTMRNWWTEKDKAAFKERTGALVSQYNEFKVFPDLNVNGEFTLGENIGDLGGITIALKAYKKSLEGKTAPVLDGFTGEQRFFIGYAQSWLEKSREEALRNLVASNPHSPAHFRVNGIVRNIPEFYEAFKVKPGDSLYLAPEKRVKIW
ncbi:M13-type metalloendopeptidase [Flavobacterium sp. BFFFF1]|uniref:M13 family metallopeptidase n=1 Tax=Flavobacterium sp. BFFFF1 TaxID=2015557 RepID=UPI0025B82779|nr:M13-type metalloendopeptidase [Flavobacterium sp. BFFFF1]